MSPSNETANDQHLPDRPPWSEISFFRSEFNPIINERSSPVDLRSVCAIFFSFDSSMSSGLHSSWLNSLSNVWECALMEMVWNKRWCFVADSCAVVWRGVHSVDGGPGEVLYSQWYEMDAVVLDEGTAGGLNSEAVWMLARPKFNAGVLQNEYECWVSINVF